LLDELIDGKAFDELPCAALRAGTRRAHERLPATIRSGKLEALSQFQKVAVFKVRSPTYRAAAADERSATG